MFMTPLSNQQRYIFILLFISLLSILHVTKADPRLNYCGESWDDANSSCSVKCPDGTDSGCPSGQKCYAGCTNCYLSEIGNGGGKRFNYCGTTWSNANSKCDTACPGGQNDECPAGQFCFADCYNCFKSESPSTPTVPSPTAPTPTAPTSTTSKYPQSYQGNYNYCGSNWLNANSVCGASCINGCDDECPSGQSCYADCYDCSVLPPSTRTDPCPNTSTTTPTEPTPTPPTLVILIISAVAVLLSAIAGVLYIRIRKMRKYSLQTVRVVSTGELPKIVLPKNCKNHLFFSHVWKSGQAQTHAIVRKLQLYLPGIKIWLDVDSLDDISNLEKYVAESAVFVLYYSSGYFKSKNCKREIYTAIKWNKPIILLYEGDELIIEDLKMECQLNCVDSGSPTSEQILEKLLGSENAENRILWLKEGSFSAASLNRIYICLLKYLPYYKRYKNELRSGVAVPYEQVPIVIKEPINLLLQQRKYNNDFVEEIKDILLSSNEHEKINLIETDSLLNRHDTIEIEIDDSESSPNQSIPDLSAKNEHEKINLIETGSLLNRHDTIEIEIDDSESSPNQSIPDLSAKNSFFVLYLNKNTFEFDSYEEERDLINLMRFCNNEGVKILLVHEKDVSKGACDFDMFYSIAPPELLNPPIDLFREIATPLYEHEQYREVSMRILLMKMGGVPIKFSSGKWKMVEKLSKPITRTSVLEKFVLTKAMKSQRKL